jgi:DHA3 family macrolide efflux protein-like MFS transporter
MPSWKRNVVLFLTGQTVSLLGSMLVMYAVMWHLTIQTQSGAVLAASVVFGMLPQAFVSIFGGVWADRHDRKLLIMGADASIAVITLALASLMAAGIDDLWLIFTALAARSALAGIQTPAVGAITPQIVPEEHLLRVNGLLQAIQAGMMLLAPALAALAYAQLSLTGIFFIDAFTAMLGVGALALVPVTRLERTSEPASYFGDLREGVLYVARHPMVRWVLGLMGVAMVLVGAPSYLTPLMVTRTFGEEVWKLTANELFWGGGMLLGGALFAALGARLTNRAVVMAGSVVAMGVFTVGLGLSTSMWVFFGFGFLMGVTFPALSTPAMTLLQEQVDPEKLGRVFGVVGIVMTVAMPLSMVVFGPLADVVAVQTLLVVAGVSLLVVIGLALATPSGRRSLAEATAPQEVPAPQP